MVHSLLVFLAATGVGSQEQPVPKTSVTSFVEKAMPFLKRAEIGLLEHSRYPFVGSTVLESYRISDLRDAFKISVQGATFDWHNANQLVQWARLWTLGDLGEREIPFEESLTMDQAKIEPLINEYARAAGYRGTLKVSSVRLFKDSPARFFVGALPVHQGIPFTSASSVRFEVDYRHGRLIQMSLYGFPKPPANLTPHRTLEESRIEVLQKLFAKYDIPGVEEIEFKLAIDGTPLPVENDDAVKFSQRIWDVQGKLVYEALFWHVSRFPDGAPTCIFSAMIDANTNEIVRLTQLASAGGGPSGKPKSNYVLSGPITVVVGKSKKAVEAGKLEAGNGIVSDQAKNVLLISKDRAFKAKFDPKSGLLRIGDETLKPSKELLNALVTAASRPVVR